MSQKHHGEIIKTAIKQKGIKVTELTKKLEISKYKLHKAFNTPILEEAFIIRLGIAIQHDFSESIPEIAHAYTLKKSIQKQEAETLKKKINHMEEKYLQLLEHYTKLNCFLLNIAHSNQLQTLKDEISICINKMERIELDL